MATIIAVLQRLSSPPLQSLRTLQTTQATVSYTVSTRPDASTLAARLSFYLDIALRILVGCVVVFLVGLKWGASYGNVVTLLQCVLGGAHVHWLLQLAESLQWRYLAPGALAILYLALRRGYTEESLTVLRGLGLQTSTTSSIFLRTPTTRFIPTTSIQDIFIHEAFKGFEVRFYLAVVVKGEEDVVVVFPRLLPRRAILEDVWRGTRACLWEGMGVKRSEKGGVHVEA